MKDSAGKKYFSDKEKCSLMENTWRDVFRISEEDENNFDQQHSDHVNGNYNTVNPFPTVDLSRLNTENYHTREITLDEIKTCISRSKKKAPGSAKINIQ